MLLRASLFLTLALATLGCGGSKKGGTLMVDTPVLPYKAPDIEELSGVEDEPDPAEPPAEEPKAEAPAPPAPVAASPAPTAQPAATKPPAGAPAKAPAKAAAPAKPAAAPAAPAKKP